MNKIKVAKELIKLAKSLVASDIDEQTQTRLDEAEKSGKKYILHHKEGNLWRIMACKDFGNIKKGDFGGLIESEENLSHDGNCWVFEGARVYDDAKVYGNAQVSTGAKVYGGAQVYDDAWVFEGAWVYDDAKVYGRASVYNYAHVYGNETQVYGSASVYGGAKIYGGAKVYGDTQIYGRVQIDYDVKDKEIIK